MIVVFSLQMHRYPILEQELGGMLWIRMVFMKGKLGEGHKYSVDLWSGVYEVMALIMCGDWERHTRICFEETAMLLYFSKHGSKVIGPIWP